MNLVHAQFPTLLGIASSPRTSSGAPRNDTSHPVSLSPCLLAESFGGGMHVRYNQPRVYEELCMPCYTVKLDPLLTEIGVPITKSARVRLDQYIQEILGTIDADCDTVWPLLNRKMQDPQWKEQFKRQLKAKWDAHDWRQGLLS